MNSEEQVQQIKDYLTSIVIGTHTIKPLVLPENENLEEARKALKEIDSNLWDVIDILEPK